MVTKTTVTFVSHIHHCYSVMAAITVPNGGYDCKWVETPPDELKCQICTVVARDPQQHGNGGCGKVFCLTCITEYRKKNSTCPNCRNKLTTFKDERGKTLM